MLACQARRQAQKSAEAGGQCAQPAQLTTALGVWSAQAGCHNLGEKKTWNPELQPQLFPTGSVTSLFQRQAIGQHAHNGTLNRPTDRIQSRTGCETANNAAVLFVARAEGEGAGGLLQKMR